MYSVLSRVRRLEFKLRFGLFGWVVSIVAFLLIVYLQFYQSFCKFAFTPGLKLSRWNLNPQNVSFIVLLVAVIILWPYLAFRKLTRRRIGQFREIVLELSQDGRYSEMYSLVENNLKELSRIYHSNFMLFRIKQHLDNNSNKFNYNFQVRERIKNQQNSFNTHLNLTKNKIYQILAKAFPDYDRESNTARDVIHALFMNKKTVKEMIHKRPYYALAFFKYDFGEYEEFFEKYLAELAKDTNSAFYHELKNNQNLSNSFAYELPERNRLLYFLFFDCSVAEKLAPYRPVGEIVIGELDQLYANGNTDPYNGPRTDDFEYSKWESVLFVGIRFFDIMVTSALLQNINWHMWLYYFPVFAKRIVRNLKPNSKDVDYESEYPTPYHLLLYEIVSCLCNWFSSVQDMPKNQSNIILETSRVSHENGNIPKSAMIALGQVFSTVLVSNSISQRFKTYLAEIAFSRYFDLRTNNETRTYSEVLLNALRSGGCDITSPHKEYHIALFESFCRIDSVPYIIESFDEYKKVKLLLESDANGEACK